MKTATKFSLPTTVYSQGDLLYVHTGSSFRVIAKVGCEGNVKVAAGYEGVGFAEKDMTWANSREDVAACVAAACNAYPVLLGKVDKLERREAELTAKLRLATEALRRHASLKPEYVNALTADLARTADAQ